MSEAPDALCSTTRGPQRSKAAWGSPVRSVLEPRCEARVYGWSGCGGYPGIGKLLIVRLVLNRSTTSDSTSIRWRNRSVAFALVSERLESGELDLAWVQVTDIGRLLGLHRLEGLGRKLAKVLE